MADTNDEELTIEERVTNLENSLALPPNILPISEEYWEQGGIGRDNGANVDHNCRIRTKSYIEVLPNTTYTLDNFSGSGYTCGIYEYSDTAFIIMHNWVSSTDTFTTGSTTTRLRAILSHANVTNPTTVDELYTVYKFTLHKSDTSAPYWIYPILEDVAKSIATISTDVSVLSTAVSTKAPQSDLTALTSTVTALSSTVEGKADDSTVTALSGTVDDIDNRVTTLEGTGEYKLRFSGEDIDAILDSASKIHTGTTTITLTQKAAFAIASLTFSGFMPAKVVATLRQNKAISDPYYNYCVTALYSQGHWQLSLCKGSNYGSTIDYLPAGTYYIDWVAVEG